MLSLSLSASAVKRHLFILVSMDCAGTDCHEKQGKVSSRDGTLQAEKRWGRANWISPKIISTQVFCSSLYVIQTYEICILKYLLIVLDVFETRKPLVFKRKRRNRGKFWKRKPCNCSRKRRKQRLWSRFINKHHQLPFHARYSVRDQNNTINFCCCWWVNHRKPRRRKRSRRRKMRTMILIGPRSRPLLSFFSG